MKEIRHYIKGDQDITYQNLKKMDYLDMVLKEVNRFVVPTPTSVPKTVL